ncbi:MAG: hypothetical protein WAK16_02885 [Candidatus Cybelea sp.]
MIRTLVLASAIALALLPPVVALGAPTPVLRGTPVSHLPPPRAAEGRSGSDSFRVPFHVDARPKPAERDMETTLLPYRLHPLQPSSRYLWNQPAWYENGCFVNNLSGVPSTAPNGASIPAGLTFGSLVDDHSKHLFSSTPSYNPNSPSISGAAVTSSPVGSQYQVQPTPCGSASLFNF